jgi:hypothetical protein
MGLDFASKVPPTIIYTTEYDSFRRNAEEACDLYEEAGTLLDCGIQAGTVHMRLNNWDLPEMDVWF